MKGLIPAVAILAAGAVTGASASTFNGTQRVDEFCAITTVKLCENAAFVTSDPFDMTIAAPTTITGDAVLVFTAWGDFNNAPGELPPQSSEHLIIEAEGFSFGNFLNNDPTDDIFADDGFAGGRLHDVGNEYGYPKQKDGPLNQPPYDPWVEAPPRSGTAIIPEAIMRSILADGVFTLTIRTFGNVSDGPWSTVVQMEEFFLADLTFETGPASTVPLPPASMLLVAAFAGLALTGRTRRRV